MKYILLLLLPFLTCCNHKNHYDKIIRNGLVYDGNGSKPFKGDVAMNADTIAAIGDLSNDAANEIIDANGMAVTPGFINMLSWATESLIEDGRSQSDIRQGVMLDVMGEGFSIGNYADVLVFDPAKINDAATYANE